MGSQIQSYKDSWSTFTTPKLGQTVLQFSTFFLSFSNGLAYIKLSKLTTICNGHRETILEGFIKYVYKYLARLDHSANLNISSCHSRMV